MADANGYSPTQRRIIDVLSDGKPHHRDELKACLGDEMAGYGALNAQLTYLRKILLQHNETIICVLVNRAINYQHVKFLVPQLKLRK